MWTLSELNETDKSVISRYDGQRVLSEETTGLSLKEPATDSASQTPVRRLTYEVCGMHYSSPQYNLILLQDKINELAGTQLVDRTTYSAPRQQINFYLFDGTKKTFDPNRTIDVADFLAEFGLSAK
ncbi:MAG TPA: hypothetical protein DEP46_02025 [Blastocatellia bacterium]|nr:hypothetical protein [Blastocatellia bacterium]